MLKVQGSVFRSFREKSKLSGGSSTTTYVLGKKKEANKHQHPPANGLIDNILFFKLI